MITNQQYFTLFETIAMAVNDIGHNPPHSVRYYSNPDAIPEKGLSPQLIYMLMMRPKYGFINNDSDNLIEKFIGGFWLLKPVSKIEDFKAQDEAITSCKTAAKKIFAALKKLRSQRVIKDFDPKYIEGFDEGPVLENCYGVFYEFVIGEPDNLPFDDADYNMNIINSITSL